MGGAGPGVKRLLLYEVQPTSTAACASVLAAVANLPLET